MSPSAEQVLLDLRNHPVREPWERTVTDVAVSVLSRSGVRGLSQVLEAPGGVLGPDTELTPREMSELLKVLENAEADRLVRTREILKEVLAFALKAGEALLKAALGGLL